jgi:hypothetical protein
MKSAPRFVEIKMDAEISSYQEDFDPTRDPSFARDAEASAAEKVERTED